MKFYMYLNSIQNSWGSSKLSKLYTKLFICFVEDWTIQIIKITAYEAAQIYKGS